MSENKEIFKMPYTGSFIIEIIKEAIGKYVPIEEATFDGQEIYVLDGKINEVGDTMQLCSGGQTYHLKCEDVKSGNHSCHNDSL